MSIDIIKNALPDYAKDVKLNLSSLAYEEMLTEQQLWGTFLACAISGRNQFIVQNIEAQASKHLSHDAMKAAKAAASIMAMNNIYYRFVYLSSNNEYQNMPAKLRMNVIGNPGVEKEDFELWSLAVSAMNGCGMCIDAHEQQLLNEGVSKDQIQTAVRIAAVMNAVSITLDGEEAMAQGAIPQAA